MASANTPPPLTHATAYRSNAERNLSTTKFTGLIPCAPPYLGEEKENPWGDKHNMHDEEYPRKLERSHSVMNPDGSERDDEQAMLDLIDELAEDPDFKRHVVQLSVQGVHVLHGLRHFVIHTCNGQIYIVSSMTYRVYSIPLSGTTLREVCDFVLNVPIEMIAFSDEKYVIIDLETGEVYANLEIPFADIQNLQAILTIVY